MPYPSTRAAWLLVALAMLLYVVFASTPANAFCGFYVGKADAKLFNEASQVILVRDGNRTVISMRNDFQGELSEFALVVPVPVVLQKSQIHIGDPKTFDRIDAYSAPRLAEYFDSDPCVAALRERQMGAINAAPASMAKAQEKKDKALGVTVEARYTIGEYDIAILSATESNGLETWLKQNGYRIPAGASKALRPYVRQGLKFFVARVNLAEQAKTGFSYLRPLQFAFEYERFMLPVRLGMLNASGPQDLVVYALTRNGRVETTNYRTVKLPANVELPTYTRGEFGQFYKALFDNQSKREDYRVVWTEYFWDMAWCDPCAADPLSPEELRRAGVFWLGGDEPAIGVAPGAPGSPPIAPRTSSGAQPVRLTRLHLRYTPETLPEDLMFQETQDRQNFQARYVLRHPWTGDASACDAAPRYLDEVAKRQEREAQTLATLTGWDLNRIRARMNISAAPKTMWWERLWK
ncbi:MAG: DUF2330 domain-containing protein [Pseudomonadota bacterium]|nr:DUF2330 domain-containing protein [Pseudomonadota bacterium]